MSQAINELKALLNVSPERLYIQNVGHSASNKSKYYKVYVVEDDYRLSNYTYILADCLNMRYSLEREAIVKRGYCSVDDIVSRIWNELQLTSKHPNYPAYVF